MPTDYTSSNPMKKENKEELPPKVVEKVVVTEVIVKKKGIGKKFKDLFFAADFKTAGKYVVAEVLLPALRNMMVETSTKAIERVIYGENRPNRLRSREPGYHSYTQYYPADPRERRSEYVQLPDQRRRYINATSKYEDDSNYIISSRREAEAALEQLFDIIGKYDAASMADLRSMLGLPISNTDEKWGWQSLNGAEIRQVREGYLLRLPDPEPI